MEKGIRYSDFLKQVENRILDFMPEKFKDCKVRIEEINIDDGNIEIMGLFKEGVTAVAGISLRNYFKEFLACWDMDRVLKEIAEDYRKLDIEMRVELETGRKVTEKEMELFDFNNVRDKICYRLMSYEENLEFLEVALHRRCLDFAKVYYVLEEERDTGFSYRCIPEAMLEEWGVTINEIDKASSKNTPKFFPPALYEGEELSASFLGGPAAPNYLNAEELPETRAFYVLTNERNALGAATLMYPEVLQQIWDMMGKDYYVIPVCTEEVLIMSKESVGNNEKFLHDRLITGNKMLPDKHLLSNMVLEYTNEDLMLQPIQLYEKASKKKDYER